MSGEEEKNEERRKEKLDSVENAALSGAAAETVQRYGAAIKEHLVAYEGVDNETGKQLKRGLKHIEKSKINPEFKEQNLKQQAGFAAENKYTARENVERLIKGDKTRIKNTDMKGSGEYDQILDHVEVDGKGNIIAGEQMKFVGNDPKSALEKLASKKFQKYFDADAKVTVPSDFYQGIRDEADKSIASFQQQLERAKSDGNTKLVNELETKIAKYEKIKANVKDSGITNKEAMEARTSPMLSTAKDVAKLSHRAGVEQAKFGAVISGSVSLVKNITAVVKGGEEDPGEAALNVLKDTGSGALVSYATGFAGSALKGAMQNATADSVRALARTNIAATVVIVALESGKSIGKYLRGEIDGVECLEELGEKGTGLLSSAMFAVAGQALIPIPVVGAMIGSMVGYALSSACYGELLKAGKEAKLARAERIRVEKECAEAVKLIRQYRREMEVQISQYMGEHIAVFTDAFRQMNSAIGLNDIDGFMAGANKITRKLGGKPQFETFSEFNEFMKGDEPLKL